MPDARVTVFGAAGGAVSTFTFSGSGGGGSILASSFTGDGVDDVTTGGVTTG